MNTANQSDFADFGELGRRLLVSRLLNGLTQQQLAERSAVDRVTINRIERRHRLPTLPQLARLARGLQISVQWFLSGSNYAGLQLPDIAFELHALGVLDLWFLKPRIIGAFRPPEEVVAVAVSGDQPEPRIIEAIPAALAWNPSWRVPLLHAYGRLHDRRAVNRLGWLADVALTIDRNTGFPGGIDARPDLARFVARVKPNDKDRPSSRELDDLGRPSTEGRLPPVWRRWHINYAGGLASFRDRATQLLLLRDQVFPGHAKGPRP